MCYLLGFGYYIYYEVTRTFERHTAALEIPVNLKSLEYYCLNFAYHMYGEDMGTLSVMYNSGIRRQTIWRRSGNIGNKWERAVVRIRLVQPTSNVSIKA